MRTVTMLSILVGFTAALLIVYTTQNDAALMAEYELPKKLLKPPSPSMGIRAIYTDTVKSWVDWSTPSKSVYLRGKRRANISLPWPDLTERVESCSFEVGDLGYTCDEQRSRLKTLFISGMYPDGKSTIEKWTFNYHSGLGSGSFTIYRSILLHSDQYGVIVSLAVDPMERFLLFLTWGEADDNKIYRLTIPASGGTGGGSPPTPTVVVEQGTLEVLGDAVSIRRWQHVTEGAKFVVLDYADWWEKRSPVVNTVVLSDPDDNGSIDSINTYDWASWEANAYHEMSSWVALYSFP